MSSQSHKTGEGEGRVSWMGSVQEKTKTHGA